MRRVRDVNGYSADAVSLSQPNTRVDRHPNVAAA